MTKAYLQSNVTQHSFTGILSIQMLLTFAISTRLHPSLKQWVPVLIVHESESSGEWQGCVILPNRRTLMPSFKSHSCNLCPLYFESIQDQWPSKSWPRLGFVFEPLVIEFLKNTLPTRTYPSILDRARGPKQFGTKFPATSTPWYLCFRYDSCCMCDSEESSPVSAIPPHLYAIFHSVYAVSSAFPD